MPTATVIDRTESQVPVVDQALARTDAPNALVVVSAEVPISAILDRAVQQGMAPEALEKLVALFNQQQDRAAAREFSGAMAAFQTECPPIPKTSTASIVTKSGAKYAYTYAELDEIARTIGPYLHKHGLSYSWDSSEDKGSIVCTCIVRHANGHRETAKFACPTDSAASMSGAQRQAAALTYARRQSLVQALGLTTADTDTDAARHEPAADPTPITADQAANLKVLIDEVKPDMPKMLAYFGVESIEQIPAARFKEAVAGLEKRRKA